jgi:hypothetical protein
MNKSAIREKIRYLAEYIAEFYSLEGHTMDGIMASVDCLLVDRTYEEVEKLYKEGYIATSLYRINEVNWWYTMALGGLLLTSYGISEAEFTQWVLNQEGEETTFLMLLLSEKLSEEDYDDIGEYFWKRLQNSKANLRKRRWAKVVKRKDNAFTFQILDHYIEFDKNFISYCEVEEYRAGLETRLLEFFEEKIKELEVMPRKGNDNFPVALKILVEFIIEGFEKFYVAHVSYLREHKVETQKISAFQKFFNEIFFSFKEELNKIVTKVANLYVENYPQGEQRDHRYIETVKNIHTFRRAMELPYNGVEGLVQQTTNVVLRDMEGEIAKGVSDYFLNTIDRISFEHKIEKLFTWEFWGEPFNDMVHEFSTKLEDEFFLSLEYENYNIKNKRVYGYYLNALVPENRGGRYKEVNENARKTQLLELILDFPCDSEVYGLITFLYGNSQDISEMISKFGDEKIWNKSVEAYEEVFAEGILENLSNLDKNTLFVQRSNVEEYLLEQGFANSTEIIRARKLQLLVQKLDVFCETFEKWEAGLKLIEETKQDVHDAVIQMDDDKLLEMAEKGNGYAFYFIKELLNRNGTGASIFYNAKKTPQKPLSKYIISYATCRGNMNQEELNQFVEKNVLAAIGDYAIEVLENLEFSDKEFLENKIDINQYAKAWNDVLYAESLGYIPAFAFHYEASSEEEYGFCSQTAVQEFIERNIDKLGLTR